MKIFILILCIFSSSSFSSELSVNSYGDLYLVEEKISLDSSVDDHLIFGSVINHSVFNVYYLNYSLKKYFNNYFNYGFDFVYNFINQRKFFEVVSSVIENDGKVIVRYPDFGAHLFIGLTPIKGALNWMNTKNFSFYLQTNIGAGVMYDESEDEKIYPSIFSSLSFRFELTKSLGLQLGLRQQFVEIKKSFEQCTAIEFGINYMIN